MIPKFKDYFYPFILALENEDKRISAIRIYIAAYFNLTTSDLSELTKGGKNKHTDRTAWTASYLKKMGLIDRTGNIYTLTQKGRKALEQYGDKFSLNILRDMEGYINFKNPNNNKTHWVAGHYRSDGTYVAGYASNFVCQGIRKK